MQWFENEQFWLNYGPVMFDSKRWAEAETVAESICAIAGLSKGNSILSRANSPVSTPVKKSTALSAPGIVSTV